MTASARQVERIPRLSRAAFERDFFRQNRPVIIGDVLGDWPALRDWTPESLAARIGPRPIDVVVSETGLFAYRPDGLAYRCQPMAFTDAVDLICKRTPSTETHYIMQTPVPKDYPELMADIAVPEYAVGRRSLPLLWFGAAGCVTPLHFDTANNWFAQIVGRKHFTLYDPGQTARLYPFPADSLYPNMSFVNPEAPDLARHPDFAAAEPMECVVEPGDLLYLPGLWWHQVRSLSVGISISSFVTLTLSQLLAPQGLRLLPRASREHMRELLPQIAESGVAGGFLGQARALVERGRFWPAVVFARAALADREALFTGVDSGPLHDQLTGWIAVIGRAVGNDRDLVTRDEAADLIAGIAALAP